MVLESSSPELFSFGEAFGQTQKYKHHLNPAKQRKKSELRFRDDTKWEPSEQVKPYISHPRVKEKGILVQRRRLEFKKLFCNVPFNSPQPGSTRTASTDVFVPRRSSGQSEAVSITLRSYGVSEDDDKSVDATAQYGARLPRNRSLSRYMSFRENFVQHDFETWYIARKGDTHHYGGVMYAVFFDQDEEYEA